MSQIEPISNPELAERQIATLFVTLYESWPVRITIDAQQVTGVIFDTDSLYDTPSTPIPKEWTICSELFVWLENEGYIKTDGAIGSIWTLGRTQLTHKAIETMKSLPDPLNPEKKRTLIDAIIDVSKDGGKQARNQIISFAMSALYEAVK
ncbi:Restriction system protein Mrr-like N-terminal domain-containing protein [Vibrio crassostreae]|uniref:hypothetical protein n=1 Tax=Vibrio crassostreae TaxID=246167 RepID=UPI001B30DCE2|nr:hypothetical protein [Vibrio crassostreae]CAK3965701.1 Restriction system protein Mrr-like N-terminal domain-containing protein [Vibrio crassostreae]